MKHIKQFENFEEDFEEEPRVGYFVICEVTNSAMGSAALAEHVNTNIGKITSVDNYQTDYPYHILYEDYAIGKNFETTVVCRDEIKYFAKNKADLETIIEAEKYNM